MFSLFLIPCIIAMFLALTMGGSGTAPSFAAAYGANLIRKDLIPGLFGIFVFAGALLAGKKVVETLGGGILPADVMTLTLTSIILLSVAISLLTANLMGIPQSTSQSTVFALMGPALYMGNLNTHKVFFEIVPTWFIMPIIAFTLMYLIGRYYRPLKRFVSFKEMKSHPMMRYVVILTSCYVAFSIGSNNVANAAGPIASMIINELHIDISGGNYLLVVIVSTLMIAPCFSIGSSLFGHKLVETSGKDIINIGPMGASIISFLTATLLLSASLIKGIPTSLVQLNTAAILALGITKTSWKNIFSNSTVKRFWTVWIVTPIFALLFSLLLTFLADKMGILHY